jgi:phosphatidylglycerophosphatase A
MGTATIRLARLTATVCGIGHAPAMPGTWASAAALPAAWGLQVLGGVPLLAAATFVAFALGLWASGVMLRETHTTEQDPRWIVIDEVAAQWMVLLVVPPDINLYAIAFVLFRIADVWKPWPASWADRVLTGAAGVMVDDIFAAAWAAIVLIVFRYAWFI